MTLGEKIRKYRLLKGLTQKELGLAVGFSATTADSRIRKYESDLMAPKDKIRTKLAEVLNVDLSALSDIDIHNFEDVMHALFLFEDSFGMDLEKRGGKTYLIFDDNNQKINTLTTFMNIWRNQRTAMIPNPGNVTAEQSKAYEIWKSRFAKNIREYFSSKENEISKRYEPLISHAEKNYPYAKKTSEITLLLRKIIESGFTVSTTYDDPLIAASGPGFIFVVNELLNPPSEKAAGLFAQFQSELKHFSDLGAEIRSEMQMLDKLLTITYFIPIPSFTVIKNQIDSLLKYLNNSANENDFSRDTFERNFEDRLKTYYNYIEDEIKSYCNR